jgi:hypothetical protein
VTDSRKAKQGNKSHKDVEAIIHHFNTYTHITATKAEPFHHGKQTDILLSGIILSTTRRPRTGTSTSRLPTPSASPTK